MTTSSRDRPRRPVAPARIGGSGQALSLIRAGQARTIGELASAMDMARSTVAQRVEHLLGAGLVVTTTGDGAGAPVGRGRPPTLLQFNPDSGVVLVAHLGMTGARVAVTDLGGSIVSERFEAVPIESGPDVVLDRLRTSLSGVLSASGRVEADVRGVGIGLPSAIELATAPTAGGSTTRSWEGFPVRDRLRVGFGVPTFVDNDVNLLAMGEQRSCWPGTDVLLCVKAGSVIGSGTVIRGDVVSGAQGVAGSIGHIPVPGDLTPCSCGNLGCLDAVASGRVLATRLRASGLPVEDARDVAALARRGVPEAAQAVRAAGRSIGEVLAYAVNLLNPGVIAVWGYLTEAEAQLFAGIRESVYQRSLPAATRSLQLVRARLGDDAGLTGTAMMVVSHILSPEALDEHLTVGAADGAA